LTLPPTAARTRNDSTHHPHAHGHESAPAGKAFERSRTVGDYANLMMTQKAGTRARPFAGRTSPNRGTGLRTTALSCSETKANAAHSYRCCPGGAIASAHRPSPPSRLRRGHPSNPSEGPAILVETSPPLTQPIDSTGTMVIYSGSGKLGRAQSGTVEYVCGQCFLNDAQVAPGLWTTGALTATHRHRRPTVGPDGVALVVIRLPWPGDLAQAVQGDTRVSHPCHPVCLRP